MCNCSVYQKKCDELKKTCELLTARKMGLGDNLPREFVHFKTSSLREDSIEPKNIIDYLEMESCVDNKKSEGGLTSVFSTHDDISEDGGRLPIRFRRKKGQLKYWKAGWIEEIEDKM